LTETFPHIRSLTRDDIFAVANLHGRHRGPPFKGAAASSAIFYEGGSIVVVAALVPTMDDG
jgi:hypothetical protein